MHLAFHRPKLTHGQVLRISITFFALIMLIEGLVALHLLSGHDAFAGSLVVTAWFRDGISVVIEHLVFDAAESAAL